MARLELAGWKVAVPVEQGGTELSRSGRSKNAHVDT